jgi:hypothetical protein
MPSTAWVAPEHRHIILLRCVRRIGLLSNHVSHTNLPFGKFVYLLRRTRESGSAPRTKNCPCIGIGGHGRTAKETTHLNLRTRLSPSHLKTSIRVIQEVYANGGSLSRGLYYKVLFSPKFPQYLVFHIIKFAHI